MHNQNTFDPFAPREELPPTPPSLGPLEVLGLLFEQPTLDAEGMPTAPPKPLHGWHVNSPWPIPGWEAWHVTPKAPRRVFGGGVTTHYTFATEAEFLAALETAYLGPPLPTLSELQAQALRRIEDAHADTLQSLTGQPTGPEQTTWAGKVPLATALATGMDLEPYQRAYLHMAGITTDADRKNYAHSVLSKSDQYWALVGLADKVRADCKARVKAATTVDELQAAMAANAVQAAEAIKRVKP